MKEWDLARSYHRSGDLVQAEQIYAEILKTEPGNAQVWYLRGAACLALGRLEDAVASLQEAIRIRPDYAHAHNHLGVAFAQQERIKLAVTSFREAVQLMPELAKAHHNLGQALLKEQKLDEAAISLQNAVTLQPNWVEAHVSLAKTFMVLGKIDHAAASFRNVLALKPQDADIHSYLGRALVEVSKLDEAVASFSEAIKIKPDFAEAYNSLGVALLQMGRPDDALQSFRLAVQHKPSFAVAHSNLLFSMHYTPVDSTQLLAQHCAWARQHAEGLASPKIVPDHKRDRSERLRIGYVSADFRQDHPVAVLLEPVLAAHDHTCFHITCYADVYKSDLGTQRLQGMADEWRSIVGLSDAVIADQVRADRIDILIDLAGHTARNHLLLFARKPAPIQATYIGYPDTTGLTTMDYRITDGYGDPPGLTEHYHTEKLVRLPDIAWCYQPSSYSDVTALPAFVRGNITFGSFNNIPKITPSVIAVWSHILRALPEACLKLMTNYRGQSDSRILEAFASHGIHHERIRLLVRQPRDDYFREYGTVDICLDPFPYSGGLTTCDSLWMGVPVITLAGRTCISRQGVALLSNVGLHDLIAATQSDYVTIAIRLASDLHRLREIRNDLRSRMKKSALLNWKLLTGNLEAAYREMWNEMGSS